MPTAAGGWTGGESSTPARVWIGRGSLTASNSPAGPHTKTANPCAPSKSAPVKKSRARSESLRSSPCCSRVRPSPSRTQRSAWSSSELISVARARAVPNCDGSRLRKRLRTRAPSGRRSASRRRRSPLSSLVCMIRRSTRSRKRGLALLVVAFRVALRGRLELLLALLALRLAARGVLSLEGVRPRGGVVDRAGNALVGLLRLPVRARVLDLLLHAVALLLRVVGLLLELVGAVVVLHRSSWSSPAVAPRQPWSSPAAASRSA